MTSEEVLWLIEKRPRGGEQWQGLYAGREERTARALLRGFRRGAPAFCYRLIRLVTIREVMEE